MRAKRTSQGLRVQAIAGTHVVLLGMHMEHAAARGLLGFAIMREDLADGERTWLRGMKRFQATDPRDGIGEAFSSRAHPFQSFQWADYSAKPGRAYRYRVVALRGHPTALVEAESVSVAITTESGSTGAHSVFFNRGATASQEYARRFQNRNPDEIGAPAFTWLSRGLIEGLLAFIAEASGAGWSLHGAIYEFESPEVMAALKAAASAGAEVRVVYAANKDIRAANEKAIAAARIKGLCTPRANTSGIPHNKFFVLAKDGAAQAVWTGGTNLTKNGIYGHSNQAHIVRDVTLAGAFLDYWNLLAADIDRPSLREFTSANPATPVRPLRRGSIAVFAPRQGLSALDWYAALAAGAKRGLFMTFAFGMNPRFLDVYRQDDAVLRYALMEKAGVNDAGKRAVAAVRRRPNVTVAVGNRIALNRFDNWLAEVRNLTGSKYVHWIHTKYMLIDPLGPDPIVVAGSANFSDASVTGNDENMLVIRGDKAVADIYLGEFMRLFTHYAFREFAARRKGQANEPRYLAPDDSWLAEGYYRPGADRALRRAYFAGV